MDQQHPIYTSLYAKNLENFEEVRPVLNRAGTTSKLMKLNINISNTKFMTYGHLSIYQQKRKSIQIFGKIAVSPN